MKVVLQRVSRARVTIAGQVHGEIGRGLLLLVGFTEGDTDEGLRWMAEKVVGLRIFPDEAGKMNRSVEEIEGALLVVSQFTLYSDASRGRRPSFVEAAVKIVRMDWAVRPSLPITLPTSLLATLSSINEL